MTDQNVKRSDGMDQKIRIPVLFVNDVRNAG